MVATTRTKTLEVKGGFYSQADMKSDLGYSQFHACKNEWCIFRLSRYIILLSTTIWHVNLRDRIDKIVKWATERGLHRWLDLAFSTQTYTAATPRKCEYDSDVAEYWVNTRTEGSLKREDIERLERKRSHEQDCEAADFDNMDFQHGGFAGDLGAPGPLEVEGDSQKSVTWIDPAILMFIICVFFVLLFHLISVCCA